MASRDYGFTKPMKQSLRCNTVELVNNLENIEGIMDHLVQANVFPDAEDVLYLVKRKDRVRKLLDCLPKRPASNYWVFLECLYHPTIKQEHMAEKILQKFQEHGGEISNGQVQRLSSDYRERQQWEAQSRFPVDGSVQPPPQPSPIPHTHLSELQSDGQGQQTLTGNPLTMEAMETDHYNPQMQQGSSVITTDSGGAGDASQQMCLESPGGPIEQHAPCPQKKKQYKMDSVPRGQALIINNHNFYHLDDREGTNEDCEQLHDLFRYFLGFDVEIKPNLTGQNMRGELEKFAQGLRSQCDSCMVAILTHGYTGGVLFGTDGRIDAGSPVPNTFIISEELKDIFSSTNCREMEGKPKMMIIQACKGTRDDTVNGPRVLRDVVLEPERLNHERHRPDRADMVFLEATVDNYVAYRNRFIKILCTKFKEDARTEHILELSTGINAAMSESRVDGHIFTISEGKHTLSKLWYLQPPST